MRILGQMAADAEAKTQGDVLRVLHRFEHDPELSSLVVARRVSPPAEAVYANLPEGLDPRLAPALAARGIHRLYCHQREAFDHVGAHESSVVVTPTASG